MKKFLIILLTFSIISCGDDEPLVVIPQCVDDLIPVFGEDACPGSGDLTIWNFAGEQVYCFNEGNCYSDARALIYDENCALICVLGGINGNEICDGLSWPDNAFYEDLVFRY